MARFDSSYFQASDCSYDLLHYKPECAHLIITKQKGKNYIIDQICYSVCSEWEFIIFMLLFISVNMVFFSSSAILQLAGVWQPDIIIKGIKRRAESLPV